jgi:hypothetical protein
MKDDAGLAQLRHLARRAAAWPALLRDLAASTLALWSICAGEVLALTLPLPGVAIFALPGLLIAWWMLGWQSAAFALLVSALAASLLATSGAKGFAGVGAPEALGFLAIGLGLVTVLLAARAWVKRENRAASLLLDACAGDALSRIRAAERRVAEADATAASACAALAHAEAELAEARHAAEVAHREPPLRDDGIEAARRAEGGI